MAGAFVKSFTGSVNNGTTATVPVSTAFTVNNLVIGWVGVRAGGDSFTTPSGFTAGPWASNGQSGGANFYKVASGLETAVDFEFTDAGWALAGLAEYSGLEPTPTLESSGSNDQIGSTVQTINAGTATPTTNNGLAITTIFVKAQSNWDPLSIDNGYTKDLEANHPNTTSDPRIAIASKVYTSTAAQSPNWSTTDTGGGGLAAVFAFKEAAAALPAPFNFSVVEGTNTQRVDITVETDTTGTVASWHFRDGPLPTDTEIYSEVTADKTYTGNEINFGGGHGQKGPVYASYKVGTDESPSDGPVWYQQTDVTAPDISSITIVPSQPSANVLRVTVDGAVENESSLDPFEGYEIFVGAVSQGFATPTNIALLTDPWTFDYAWTPGDTASVTLKAKNVVPLQSGASAASVFVFPEITSDAITLIEPEASYSYSITGTGSGTLTMTAPTLPAWLTLTGTHPGPWTLSGTVPAGTNSYPVVLRLTDNASTPNLYVEQSFTIFAGDTKGRPTVLGFSGFAMSG